MEPRTPSDAPVVAYAPEAVLELEHVAAWLRVGARTVERLDIPYVLIGPRTRRYLAADVLAYLRQRRAASHGGGV